MSKKKMSFSDRAGVVLDSFIGIFNPAAGFRRQQNRIAREMLSSAFPYKGAQRNRFNSDWVTSSGSADHDLTSCLPELRQRSRDLVRNDPHAAGIMLTMKTNVIGTGIKPQSSIDWEALGIEADEAEKFETLAEKAFAKWVPYADAQGRMDFYEFQDLVEGQILLNGEVIVIEQRITTEPWRPYAIAYEAVEADRLATPSAFKSDKNVRNGVRLGERGEPVGYYIKKAHPGDRILSVTDRDEYIYYPMYNELGRKQVYHLYYVERPNQSRGLPVLAPAIEYFFQKHKYMEAEQIAARVAACLVGVIKKENPIENVLSRTTADAHGNRLEKMAPGKYEYLAQGESLELINPMRPNSSFESFVITTIRAISTSIGIPYEIVAKDFSKANYSSMRSALIEARRYFIKRQDWQQRKFLNPAWEAVLEEAFLKGELGDIPFYENQAEYTYARWVAQGWPWVDPKKEVEASAIAVDKGLSTRSREAAHQGRDFFEMVDEQCREIQYIQKQAKKYKVDLFSLTAAGAEPGKKLPGTKPDDAEDPEEDPEDTTDPEDVEGEDEKE